MEDWKPRTKLSAEGEATLRDVLSDPSRLRTASDQAEDADVFRRCITLIPSAHQVPQVSDLHPS